MCIPLEALLGGLIRRLRVDGVCPTTADLRALVGAGLARSDIDEALARVGGEVAVEARRRLASVRDAAPTTR